MKSILAKIGRYWAVVFFGGLAVAFFLLGQLVNVEEDPRVLRAPQTVTLELGLPLDSEALPSGHTLAKAAATNLDYGTWVRRAAAGEFAHVYYERRYEESGQNHIHVYGCRRDSPVLDYARRLVNPAMPKHHRTVKSGIEGSCYVIHTEYDPSARLVARRVCHVVSGCFAVIAFIWGLYYVWRATSQRRSAGRS